MKSNSELVEKLKEKKAKITTCESCTGGLVASSIIDIAGSSSVIDEAFVTYSNESKISIASVNKATIEKYGVVSEEVAFEMVDGVSKKAISDFAISTTGIAGPTGGSEQNPVGKVCFGFKIYDDIYTVTKIFENKGRNEIRKEAANYAISYILEKIKNL